MKKHLSLVGFVGFALFLAGCVTEPITGRQRFILTSASEESSLGAQAWTEVKTKEKPTASSKWSTAVVRVGSAVAKAVNEPSYQWEFECFASEEANAFCRPAARSRSTTASFSI